MVRFIYFDMFKTAILFLISSLIYISSHSQIPDIVWQQCYGDSGYNLHVTTQAINDGYIFAINITSGENVTNFHGGDDIWVIRTDSVYNIIWENCYGGSDADSPRKIIKVNDTEFLVFGLTWSTDGDVQSGNHGYSDIWVLKLNIQGDIIWEKTYGCIGIDDARDMILTPDGGFVFIDRIGSGGGDVTNFYGIGDCWMAKCDSLGNIEWEKTLGNDGLDNCMSLMINSAGNIMMIGAAQWYGGMVECFPDGEWADVWIVELDIQGNILAQYCYGGSHYDLGYMIIELDDGYAFVALTVSNDGDVSGLHGPPGGPPGGWGDIWVVRLDEQMEIIWQKCIGGYAGEHPNYITHTEDGGFMVIGTTRSNDGNVNGNPSKPGTDGAVWVVKLNEIGDIEWQQCYGGWGSEMLANPHTILRKSDYNYVFAATTNFSPSHDVQCETFSGNRNAWIFEIALLDTVNVITPITGAREIKVYPNPATTELWLQLPENMPFAQAQIELFSPTGTLLYKAQPISQFHKIETAYLPKGLYLLRLWDGKQWFGEKVVVR
jgi:hypothetical protein